MLDLSALKSEPARLQLLKTPHSFTDLVEKVVAEFAVNTEIADRDVGSFLKSLADEKLLQRAGADRLRA